MRLPHCFTPPWREQRARYNASFFFSVLFVSSTLVVMTSWMCSHHSTTAYYSKHLQTLYFLLQTSLLSPSPLSIGTLTL
jgi:hypothetical protein